MIDTLSHPRRVVLVELNEITWRFVDPFVKDGLLSAFAGLLRDGVRATTISPEVTPDLDPWVSWTTVYTGRPMAEHGVKFLEQPPETVHGPRVWDLVADAGRSVGIFGSIMSWPPRTDVEGFWVPGPFSPGTETHPANLRPIQDLNVGYTRAHSPLAKAEQRPSKLALLKRLKKLGLKASTIARLVGYYGRRALRLAKPWELVSLQPVINFDLFAQQWQQHKPTFSTFHTNHVAHYQHRFWRSTDPTPFLEPPSAAEVRGFGGAIRYGYQVADEILAKLRQIVTDDTVLVIASGLGQKPYVTPEFKDGRSVIRLKEITQVLDLLGVSRDDCDFYSVMAPQWNVRFKSDTALRQAEAAIAAAYYGTPGQELFAHTAVGHTINLNVRQKLPRPIDWDADCVFPSTGKKVKMRDLCAEKDATPKQGHHDDKGVLIMAGPGIRAGAVIKDCSTLDIAPTLLAIMGLPVPDHMNGRVLEEAFEPTHRRAPAVSGVA